ncbi:hypothetical protein AVEN_41982-1, partial [Araneus ventricosus]
MTNLSSVLDLLSKQWVNANVDFKTLYAQVKEIAAKLDLKKRFQEFVAFKQPATTSL